MSAPSQTLLKLSHNMDHNYRQRFLRLQEEYRAVRDSIGSDKIMNGTFGDALWVGGTTAGTNLSKPQATAPCIVVTPSSLYSEQQDAPPRTMTDTPPSEAATSSTIASTPSLSRYQSTEQSGATQSRKLEHMRPRIGHKKSRAGCFNCKKRYVNPVMK